MECNNHMCVPLLLPKFRHSLLANVYEETYIDKCVGAPMRYGFHF